VQILVAILLNAEGGQLMLAATDMELSCAPRRRLGSKASVRSSCRAGCWLELARLLPDTRCQSSSAPTRRDSHHERLLRVAAQHLYGGDFPRLPDAEGLERHTVVENALLETIARVGRSASLTSRAGLTGILVRFEPGKL